jgi:hypothetical protein
MTQALYAHMNNKKNKNKNSHWADGVAQVVECLSSKHEALSSNLGTNKKNSILKTFTNSISKMSPFGINLNFLGYWGS